MHICEAMWYAVWAELTEMRCAVLPKSCLNNLSFISIIFCDRGDFRFPILISNDVNRGLDCLCTILHSIPIIIWMVHEIIICVKGNMSNLSQSMPLSTSSISPTTQCPSRMGRNHQSPCHHPRPCSIPPCKIHASMSGQCFSQLI
jgi:hypothetical protein